jgi:hypothetical protein
MASFYCYLANDFSKSNSWLFLLGSVLRMRFFLGTSFQHTSHTVVTEPHNNFVDTVLYVFAVGSYAFLIAIIAEP